jgi:hypothetical protein
VRELGAEALVEFLPRVPACFKHWQEHAKEAGIEDVAEREAEIVDRLLPETNIELEAKSDGVVCTINNPDFSHTQWVDLSQQEIGNKSEKRIKRASIGVSRGCPLQGRSAFHPIPASILGGIESLVGRVKKSLAIERLVLALLHR